MKIGSKLREMRKLSGFSQEKAAEKIGISIHTLYSWEHDNREPSFDMLDRIAETYNTTVSYIFSTKPLQCKPKDDSSSLDAAISSLLVDYTNAILTTINVSNSSTNELQILTPKQKKDVY